MFELPGNNKVSDLSTIKLHRDQTLKTLSENSLCISVLDLLLLALLALLALLVLFAFLASLVYLHYLDYLEYLHCINY